ncbi:MAG: methyltransferase domain-containing protein [Acidobacteriota bacterium]|nr:methyltransferase domain-containing protein [Acidobacteriota bacterium]
MSPPMNHLFLYLHRKSREQKHRRFLQFLNPTPEMRILNVGAAGTRIGLQEQLESSYPHRSRIIGGGISFADVEDYRDSFPGVTAVVFDGCALPFADQSFDIVYSNAVLEHLPGKEFVERFAAEVQRVGKGWFITTPNFWYPIDPHYHLPFVQLLPEATQQRLVRRMGRMPYEHLHLLTKKELRRLFPTGEVIGCRVTFYPETLIAYQAPHTSQPAI